MLLPNAFSYFPHHAYHPSHTQLSHLVLLCDLFSLTRATCMTIGLELHLRLVGSEVKAMTPLPESISK